MAEARQRQLEPTPDDDFPPQGAPIEDPILHLVDAGPDVEPPLGELLKDSNLTSDGAATGGPPGGRTTIDEARRRGPLGLLQLLGPGLITGASDDDPSGIGTYSQVGSQFGFALLWTALFTFPLMAAMHDREVVPRVPRRPPPRKRVQVGAVGEGSPRRER